MYRHAGGLVDYDQVVVLVDDLDWLGCHWRLVPVQRVRDLVAIGDEHGGGGGGFTVDVDCAGEDGVLLFSPSPVLSDEL